MDIIIIIPKSKIEYVGAMGDYVVGKDDQFYYCGVFCGVDLSCLRANAFWTVEHLDDLPEAVDENVTLSDFCQNSLDYLLKKCEVINGRYMFTFESEAFGSFRFDHTNSINELKKIFKWIGNQYYYL